MRMPGPSSVLQLEASSSTLLLEVRARGKSRPLTAGTLCDMGYEDSLCLLTDIMDKVQADARHIVRAAMSALCLLQASCSKARVPANFSLCTVASTLWARTAVELQRASAYSAS